MTQPNRTSSAVAWASVEVLVRQGVQFGAGIVLARLLTPDEFGLVAMLVVFIALANVMVDGGFASALIQQENEDDVDSSTVFWFSVVMGTIAALLLAGCAPFIAGFYNQPVLTQLTYALALNVWLASLLSVHTALLTRHLDFEVQAKGSGISQLVGAATAIVLALRGAGVWALVAQSLVSTSVNVLLVWHLYAWRPSAVFSVGSLRRLFRFGGFMFAGSAMNTIATQLYALLIGRLYSKHDVGLYSRAVTTRDASQAMLGTIFSRVALPILAQHGTDSEALRRRLRSGNQLTMAVNLPAMAGLAMVADVAVPTLFGDQWTGAVPVLEILCVAGALYPMQVANLQALMAQGYSGKMFALGVAKNGVLVLGMLIASHWGVLAIAWSTVFSAIFSFALNTYYSRTLIGYGPLSQLRDIATCALLTASMVVVVGICDHAFSWLSPGKLLMVEMISGALFYLGGAAALRMPAIGYAIEVLGSLRSPATPSDGRG